MEQIKIKYHVKDIPKLKKIDKGDWIDILQAYVSVVHMRRWENDEINIREVLKKYKLI